VQLLKNAVKLAVEFVLILTDLLKEVQPLKKEAKVVHKELLVIVIALFNEVHPKNILLPVNKFGIFQLIVWLKEVHAWNILEAIVIASGFNCMVLIFVAKKAKLVSEGQTSVSVALTTKLEQPEKELYNWVKVTIPQLSTLNNFKQSISLLKWIVGNIPLIFIW